MNEKLNENSGNVAIRKASTSYLWVQIVVHVTGFDNGDANVGEFYKPTKMID